jgi:hypothetical protein
VGLPIVAGLALDDTFDSIIRSRRASASREASANLFAVDGAVNDDVAEPYDVGRANKFGSGWSVYVAAE